MHCSFEEPPTQLQPGVCMYVLFWALRPGGPAVIFNQDTPRTPGIGSLENITRGLCPPPPTHPSDLTDGLHLLPLFPQLGHPRSHTHLANIPWNKNTLPQQTDHAWWTSGQASPADHPHPAPRPKALASHTELVTGQASWLSF